MPPKRKRNEDAPPAKKPTPKPPKKRSSPKNKPEKEDDDLEKTMKDGKDLMDKLEAEINETRDFLNSFIEGMKIDDVKPITPPPTTILLMPMMSPKYETPEKTSSEIVIRRQTPDESALRNQVLEAQNELDNYEKKHPNHSNISKLSIKERILLLNTSVETKSIIMKRYREAYPNGNSGLASLLQPSSESNKANVWLQAVLDIPFGIQKDIVLKTPDGKLDIASQLEKTRLLLDEAVSGHVKAKEAIICYVARVLAVGHPPTQPIALWGPAGVGKTRLARLGLSKALNLPFEAIALGGIREGSHLSGHSFTFLGARYGRLVQALMTAKQENFVLYLDELDKITQGDHSVEINGILTHLLDPETNTDFEDVYFSGIPLNFSKVLFVLSFNNIEKLDPIVRDRINVIHIPGMALEEKVDVAMSHVLPEALRDIGLAGEHIKISRTVMRHLLLKCKDAQIEGGMRESKRIINRLLERLNLLKVMNGKIGRLGNLGFSASKSETVHTFPLDLTEDLVDQLLDDDEEKRDIKPFMSMYS